MAATSSAAVLYWRPRLVTSASDATTSPAVSYVAIRSLSGLYTASGVPSSVNDRNKRPSMPPRDVPFLDAVGMVSDQWYRWFAYFWDTKFGGVRGTTVPDVEAAVTLSQVQSITAEAVAAALGQQALANAQALQAVKDVVVTAALPGAVSIPPVQLAPVEPALGGSE